MVSVCRMPPDSVQTLLITYSSQTPFRVFSIFSYSFQSAHERVYRRERPHRHRAFGTDSPAVLITTSRRIADEVTVLMPPMLADCPPGQGAGVLQHSQCLP